ncbi:uncharacterized protein TNCV_1286481 [Trichonephila clavipes]|uniref:Transposase n=1 Tax=Trichonephila clavipes TaxID=2585209 RepID=A0A8X6SQX2_TRICX|nr:uncharacterized protein TNCV_1286481 [Trichonephila clavipes]
MSRARVFEWLRRFKEGRQSVNIDPRSGRPSTSRNEDKIVQVKAVMHSDRCLTIREIAQECHISQFKRLATSSDLLQSESDDPELMKLIITGDESWVYGYDPESSSRHNGKPRFSSVKESAAGAIKDQSHCWGLVPMCFSLRKRDEDVDTTPFFHTRLIRSMSEHLRWAP